MRIAVSSRLAALLLVAPCLAAACSGPSSDDLAAQSARTADPDHRAEAIANTSRLADRVLAPKGTSDFPQRLGAYNRVATPNLVLGFHRSLDDRRNALSLLDLLAKMHDPNAAPAYAEALERPSPDRALRASKVAHAVLALEEIPLAARRRLARALGVAFVDLVFRAPNHEPPASPTPDAVTHGRVDPSLRLPDDSLARELVDALAHLGDEGLAVLGELYLRDLHGVPPAVVRELAQRLADIATPPAIPALIRGLFARPDCSMHPLQGIARDGLLRVGGPAIAPLVRVARLQDPSALEAAELALTVLPNSGTPMTKEALVRSTALDVLVELEAPELFSLLADSLARGSFEERARTVSTLIVVGGDASQARLCHQVLVELLQDRSPEATADLRSRLVGLVYATFDVDLLPVLLERASDPQEESAVRLAAVRAYAFFADRSQARVLRAVIGREPSGRAGGLQQAFALVMPALTSADVCDTDAACWRDRVREPDPLLARKAVVMLGRLGAPDATTLAALTGAFDHPAMDVRIAALRAIDHLAVDGAPAVLAQIDLMLRRPESNDTRQFNPAALRLARRLRSRVR